MDVGKCPKCDSFLTTNDIEQVELNLYPPKNYAYVCKKCNYIIGFGVKKN